MAHIYLSRTVWCSEDGERKQRTDRAQDSGQAKRAAESERRIVDEEVYDPVKIYHEIGLLGPIRKKKNEPIPLPVPIPNVNKRSRGRKVPFVANAEDIRGGKHSMVKIDMVSDHDEDEYVPTNNRSRKRRKTTTSPSLASVHGPGPVVDDGLERSYVCVVPGCGKCFVRGEHLKRHVRSIHTHEKRKS